MSEYYGNEPNNLPKSAFPLRLKDIQRYQNEDKELKDKAQYDDKYSITPYHGGGKSRHLIMKDKKICVPTVLQQRIIDWYHIQLCHPGENRTEQTI